jgi:hypothetical protein
MKKTKTSKVKQDMLARSYTMGADPLASRRSSARTTELSTPMRLSLCSCSV